MGDYRPFGKLLALFDIISFEDDDVLGNRDQMLLFRSGIGISDDDATFTTNTGTKIHHTIHFGDFSSILGTPCLEKFRYTRQTTCNVFSLTGFARSLGHQGTRRNFCTFLDDDMGSRGNGIIGYYLSIFRFQYHHLGMKILFVVDDHHGLLARRFIHLLFHGDPFDDIVEFHNSSSLGENRDVVRIPLNKGLSFFNFAPIGYEDH